jgi:hypothetical protein
MSLSMLLLCSKPSNVVVTGPLPGGRVKLCDFGLSRHISTATEVNLKNNFCNPYPYIPTSKSKIFLVFWLFSSLNWQNLPSNSNLNLRRTFANYLQEKTRTYLLNCKSRKIKLRIKVQSRFRITKNAYKMHISKELHAWNVEFIREDSFWSI